MSLRKSVFVMGVLFALTGCINEYGQVVNNISGALNGMTTGEKSWEGGDNNARAVTVQGVGVNEQEAIQNAGKLAVQQVVGAYVVSEENMENNEIITDRVLTHSNAFIRKFEVQKRYVDDDGLYNVVGVAHVETRKLHQKLGELNIGTKDIGTAEGKAITDSRFDQAQGLRDLLKQVVFDPVRNNKAYEVSVTHFNPMELYPGDVHLPRGVKQKQIDQKDVLPFKVIFKVPFSRQYMSDLTTVFSKIADKKQLSLSTLLLAGQNTENKRKDPAICLMNVNILSSFNQGKKKTEFTIACRPQKRFNVNPDKWATYTSLYDELYQGYSPVLRVTLLGTSGKVIGTACYKARRKQFGVDEKKTNLACSTQILLDHHRRSLITGSRKITLAYPRKLEKGCISGLMGDQYALAHNANDHHVVVYLKRKQSNMLKDVRVALAWEKNR